MNKRELRDSDIELVYIYAESVQDEFEKDVYQHISLNLSDNMVVAYDYEKGLLKIEKKKRKPDNFWAMDHNEKTNILSNVLILGENGTGKTTLLEMIDAGNLEYVETRLGKYMFLYSIKGSDMYYIKSLGLQWTDKLDWSVHNSINLSEEKSPIKGSPEYYSYFFNFKRTDLPKRTGYCGLITVDPSGEIIRDKYVVEIQNLVQMREHWVEIPMNGIYLPTSLTESEEERRFVSRKSILRNGIVTNSDIVEFIRDDVKKEKSIIKSKPYLIFASIGVMDFAQNAEEFKAYYRKIYETIYEPIGVDLSVGNKYTFMARVWLSFMLRLHFEQLLKADFWEHLGKAQTYKELYENIQTLFRELYKYESDDSNQAYCRLLQAVENLDEEIFASSICRKIPWGISWNISIEAIEKRDDWFQQIIEFINANDNFEKELQIRIRKERHWVDTRNFIMNHRISNMSSGETILISNVFAKIAKHMRVIMNQIKGSYPKSVLLIMDEPDCTFHIRWTQQFIKYLIEYLNAHYPQFSFQIILSSHMPFLATDYPRDNIICIPGEDWLQNQERNAYTWLDGSSLLENREMYYGLKAFTPNYGFMSNYYDVVKDNFFVDVPIGMFAQYRFDNLKRRVDAIDDSTGEQEIDDIEQEIELIDEPVLKKYIATALQEKKLERMNRAEVEEQVALLERQLEELNKRLSDMRE